MAFLVTAAVQSEVRFAEYKAAVELSINAALVKGAEIMLAEVVAAETRIGDASPKRRVSPGVHLHQSFHASIEKGFGALGGLAGIIVWTDNPNAIWQELGTRGRRRKSLKSGAPRHTQWAASHTPGNRGVKPLYFMRRGLARAYPEVAALVAAALASGAEFGPLSKSFGTTALGRVEGLTPVG